MLTQPIQIYGSWKHSACSWSVLEFINNAKIFKYVI